MKSPLHFTDTRGDRDPLAAPHGAAVLPKVEYFYQASLRDFAGRCGREERPSFRSISDSYFKTDARRIFAMESALFAVICGIVAVTAVLSASDVAHFFRAIVAA